MKCPKCNGLMYTERFMDFDGVFDLWKCINCGAFTDPIIFRNQHLTLKPETETVPSILEDEEMEAVSCTKNKAKHYAATSH